MSAVTTDASFKQDVLDSTVPVLVDFWAPWCGPCRMVGPVLEKISQRADGKAKVFKVNVDENPGLSGQYGITAIPTVMVFRGGKAEKQLIGVQPEATYAAALGL